MSLSTLVTTWALKIIKAWLASSSANFTSWETLRSGWASNNVACFVLFKLPGVLMESQDF